jgi:hypothetical protein
MISIAYDRDGLAACHLNDRLLSTVGIVVDHHRIRLMSNINDLAYDDLNRPALAVTERRGSLAPTSIQKLGGCVDARILVRPAQRDARQRPDARLGVHPRQTSQIDQCPCAPRHLQDFAFPRFVASHSHFATFHLPLPIMRFGIVVTFTPFVGRISFLPLRLILFTVTSVAGLIVFKGELQCAC